jgi:hypothetical protein
MLTLIERLSIGLATVALALGTSAGCRSTPEHGAHQSPADAVQAPSVASSAEAPAENPDLDVLEAVYRHELERWLRAAGHRIDCFFLAYPEKDDPPAELLSRFAAHIPPVRPQSQALVKWEGVEGKGAGERGVIFRISSIRWLDGDTAEVKGGHYEGNRSASWRRYNLVRRNGHWEVAKAVTYGAS